MCDDESATTQSIVAIDFSYRLNRVLCGAEIDDANDFIGAALRRVGRRERRASHGGVRRDEDVRVGGNATLGAKGAHRGQQAEPRRRRGLGARASCPHVSVRRSVCAFPGGVCVGRDVRAKRPRFQTVRALVPVALAGRQTANPGAYARDDERRRYATHSSAGVVRNSASGTPPCPATTHRACGKRRANSSRPLTDLRRAPLLTSKAASAGPRASTKSAS